MNCPLEHDQQSVFSPGKVGDCEILIKVLYDPDHFDEGCGQISLQAVPRDHLLGAGKDGKGFSLARKDHATAGALEEHVLKPALEKHPGRCARGAMVSSCKTIREIVDFPSGPRLFCVNDDGTEQLPSHALVVFSEATRQKGFWQNRMEGWARDAVRRKLINHFQLHPTIESCFR